VLPEKSIQTSNLLHEIYKKHIFEAELLLPPPPKKRERVVLLPLKYAKIPYRNTFNHPIKSR